MSTSNHFPHLTQLVQTVYGRAGRLSWIDPLVWPWPPGAVRLEGVVRDHLEPGDRYWLSEVCIDPDDDRREAMEAKWPALVRFLHAVLWDDLLWTTAVVNDSHLSVLAACDFVRERHDHWVRVLDNWQDVAMPRAGVCPPDVEVVPEYRRWSGRYRAGRCQYCLPYAMCEPDYDTTIAHEVCHHFARRLMPDSKWHGDFFYFLLREVCRCPAERTHSYDTERAKGVATVVKLWAEQSGQAPWRENSTQYHGGQS